MMRKLIRVLNQLQGIPNSLRKNNIDFNFKFDDTIHDKYITINNRWEIILGRGLDIWKKVEIGSEINE